MTTEKLTARLSDGTEWEVISRAGPTCGMRSGVPYRDETIRVELRPLKPSPPKEVYLRVYSDESVSATYLTVNEAIACTRGYSGPSNIHRYILAPEPEPVPKPAQEWWVVKSFQTGKVIESFDSRDTANIFSLNCSRPVEVVHVREVVSDGK